MSIEVFNFSETPSLNSQDTYYSVDSEPVPATLTAEQLQILEWLEEGLIDPTVAADALDELAKYI